ncbi:MAG TPA: galactose oxidase [Verrucomicrobiae bacterium]
MASILNGRAVTNGYPAITWSQLPPVPDKFGVAAPFVGTSGGALIVAGGANFPNGYPWQSGKKVWHDTIYVLTATNAQWQVAGQLPRPLAYGVSVTTPAGVLCIGGSDATQHYAEVFLLKFSGHKIETKQFPSLPIPLADAAGTIIGSTVLVCGGAERPGEQAALNRLFALDLAASSPHWQEWEPCPGKPRILPVAATIKDVFYLAGGAALEPANGKVSRVFLRDTWSYQIGRGWHRLADLPKPSVAAPSPAPSVDSTFFIVGGDDGSLAGFQPVEKHPGFPKTILAYDAAKDRWHPNGETPASRATTPVVWWQNHFVISCGEMRPGVRSPEVWTLSLGTNH